MPHCIAQYIELIHSHSLVSIQGLNKPGHYTSEKQFAEDMMAKAPSCSRRWMWHVWYMGHYVKAHGRYDRECSQKRERERERVLYCKKYRV